MPMARFVDLLVVEGPEKGMRYTLEGGAYRVIGRAGDADETRQLAPSGDRLLDEEQRLLIDGLQSRGIRTRFRSRGADILIHDDSISRTHAMVFADDSGVSVADLMSTNGTKVNGAPITDADLQPGDVISVGKTRITLLE